MIPSYHLCHREDLWDSPETFEPDRFMDLSSKQLAEIRTKKGYMPFGAGHRMCIGKNLSHEEQVLFLASIFQKYRVTLSEPEAPITMQTYLTLSSGNGIQLRFTPRH